MVCTCSGIHVSHHSLHFALNATVPLMLSLMFWTLSRADPQASNFSRKSWKSGGALDSSVVSTGESSLGLSFSHSDSNTWQKSGTNCRNKWTNDNVCMVYKQNPFKINQRGCWLWLSGVEGGGGELCRGVEWGVREAGWKHEWSHKSAVAITFIYTNQETVLAPLNQMHWCPGNS